MARRMLRSEDGTVNLHLKGPSMRSFGKLITLVITSSLITGIIRETTRRLQHRHQRRLVEQDREQLQRWRDDGGSTVTPEYPR